MAKKNEIEKLSPAKCLTSLKAYHDAILMLVTCVDTILPYIDAKLVTHLEAVNNEVKSFYES